MTSKNIDDQALNINSNILKKAYDDDPAAQLLVGMAYFTAVYMKDNCLHAFKWISCSAKQGNMEAQFRLADLYSVGQGTKRSHVDAHHWYTKAAIQGYGKALVRVHNLYQQDKKMYCRGYLNSDEEKLYLSDPEREKFRELNEYRLKKQRTTLNYAIDYYTSLLKEYKSLKKEDVDIQLKLAFMYQNGYGTRKHIMYAIQLYTNAAKQGHRDAQYNLGQLYQENPGIKFHYRFALRWYRASAFNGNTAAQNSLAYFYEKGFATELNYEGAIYWYTKSAKAGNSNAQLALGRIYRKGQGVNQNFSEALKWYTLAARQGSRAAHNCIKQLIQREDIISSANIKDISKYLNQSRIASTLRSKLEKDIENLVDCSQTRSLRILAQRALMSDGNSMFHIGIYYYNGTNLPQDKNAGFQWIKKAAKAGIQDAEIKIAEMYRSGDTAEQDYHASGLWTIKLTKKKNHKAQVNLGLLYKEGLGVRKDPLEASKWFTKSADQNNSDAQYEFGLLKLEGKGVRKDEKEALQWFLKSALQKNPRAMYQLGELYKNGDSIKRNVMQAMKMYEYAAKLGDEDAQFQLGVIYEKGEWVEKNLVKSQQYYTMAADSGEPYYQYMLAIKYINGVFEDPKHAKAFGLFKKAAERNFIFSYAIFQTPIENLFQVDDGSKILDMFILASKRGIDGIDFNVGFAYEYGITSCEAFSVSWELDIVRGGVINTHYGDSACAIEWYSLAASKNDSRALYRLGVMYEEGKYVEENLNTAFRYYSQSYANGNSEAAYSLAIWYFNGKFISQNFEKAFLLFTEAANKGHEKSKSKLIPSIARNTLVMLETVANLGYVAIQYQLGIFYEKKDEIKSFKWFKLAAEGGITDAYYRLGILFEEGRGACSDYSKAIFHYGKAVERDHEKATYRLAKIYLDGAYVECDYIKAYELFTKAAELGHNEAIKDMNTLQKSTNITTKSLQMIKHVANYGNTDLQYLIGYYYETNEGSQNYLEAFKWYEMACNSNHSGARYRLGLLYEKGTGIKQDYNKAIQLYNQEVAQNNPEILYRLGKAFRCGYGVEKNYDKSIKYYTKAAKLGNNESQYTLGVIYEEGVLVERDIQQSLKCYTNAYLNGKDNVAQELYNLYIDKPYEYFFHDRLFRVLTKWENSYKSSSDDYREIYGSMYYKLGEMYLNGIGIDRSEAEALKRFLKSYYVHDYKHAKEFVTLKYDNTKFQSKSDYMQMLDLHSTVTEDMPAGHLYKLGMLYFNGLEVFCTDKSKPSKICPCEILRIDYSTALKYFTLSSKKGNADARHQICIMYLEGYEAAQDTGLDIEWCNTEKAEDNALDWFDKGREYYMGAQWHINHKHSVFFLKKAAEMNFEAAEALLQIINLQKNGAGKDHTEELEWFKTNIKGMQRRQCYEEGMRFYNGDGVEKNHEVSLIYLTKSAEEHFGLAQAQLGLMYLQGVGVEKNYDEAMKWIEKSINEMDSLQCYEQGMEYYKRSDIEKNFEISIVYLRKAAEKNEGLALSQLGVMYLQGDGVEKNDDRATELIKKSIDKMSPRDCYEEGMRFYNGCEVERSYKISLEYLRAAADEDYFKAYAQLGVMYIQGDGVEQDYKEAMNCIEESINQMDADECYEQGKRLYRGGEVKKDYKISLLYLEKAVEEGNPSALAQMSIMYFQGSGVEKNYDKAIDYIKQSIKELRSWDCYYYGMKFYRGIDVDINYEAALLFLKRAAEEDNIYAIAQLGYMYFKGIGVKEDHQEAIRWYNRVEDGDYEVCPLYRGQIYHYDSGGIQNFPKALKFYAKDFFTRGKTDGYRGIGLLYEYGDGVDRDYRKAFEYYKTAIKIDRDHRATCLNIGLLYYYGRGVDKDYTTSLQWLTKAADGTPQHYDFHVFIQDNDIDLEVIDSSMGGKYSLQREDVLYGVAHYYMGLILKTDNSTVKTEVKSQYHFKRAFSYGINNAQNQIK